MPDYFNEALNEVYIPRIQRGDVWFAESVLRAKGALLSVLFHFFERGRWGSLVENGVEGQCLTAEDQLFVLTQAGQYLTSREETPHPKREFVTNVQSPYVIRLIDPWSYFPC